MSEKIKTVMALGLFDGVHLGHEKVILEAVKRAKGLDCVPSVFTFDGNLKKSLGLSSKLIYSFSDKVAIIKSLGVDELYVLKVSDETLNLTKEEFLNGIFSKYDVKGFVCGRDFSFGKNGEGNVEYLKEFSSRKNVAVTIVDILERDGVKISSTLIKNLLISGEIKKANTLLFKKFFIKGVVYKDRGMGKTVGFPTANIKIDGNLVEPKEGVYTGVGKVDEKTFPAIINYGTRPTFDVNVKAAEAYLDGLDYDIYGKVLTIEFSDRIRDVKKFADVAALQEQLKSDLKKLREEKYD